jgi:hypothetical protein
LSGCAVFELASHAARPNMAAMTRRTIMTLLRDVFM